MARVLVIDDSAEHRHQCSRLLEREGHSVAAAASTPEALNVLRGSPIDLVVLDLEMPHQDGIECLTLIRADPRLRKLPVLMVASSAVRDTVVRVATLGVSGIIIKDGNHMPRLIERVRASLSTASASATLLEPHKASASASQSTRQAPHSPDAAREPRTDRSHALAMSAPAASNGSTRSSTVPTTTTPVQREAPRPLHVATAPADPAPPDVPWSPPPLNTDEGGVSIERAMELLKSLKPIIARSALLDTMLSESTAVRALKPTSQQVLRMTEKATSSIQSIASAIRQDQALSLRMLRVANSTIYGRGEPVDSVPKAVSRIGMKQIRSAVLSVDVLDAFSSVGLEQHIKPDWFWEHSIACGLLTTKLAQLGGRDADHCDAMFTAGLLHDIGRLLFAEQLPEQYPFVVETADRLELPLEAVESRLLLMNHADITDRLLRFWKFPPNLIAPVSLHHLSVGTIRQTAPRLADEVMPLALANRLAHAMLLGSSGNEVLYPIEDFVEYLRIDSAKIASLVGKAADETFDLRTNLIMHAASHTKSYLDSVRASLEGVRPLSLAIDRDVDPVSIMLQRVAGTTFDSVSLEESPPDEPNIVTLRVCKANERARAMQILSHAATDDEALRARRAKLPLLVVGNSQSCHFIEGALGQRPVRQITLPIRISRLVRELTELAALAPA